jgi:hypothetical protein
MRQKFALVFGSVMLVGLALSASYAQDQQQKPTQRAAPGQTAPSGHPEMMNQMQGQMHGMMGNPEMEAQMLRIMENCNKMMESMMQKSPAAPVPQKKG